MADGPAIGLAMMDGIAATGELDTYPYLHAARADLLRRLERWSEAATAYERALELTEQRPRTRLPRRPTRPKSAEAARPERSANRESGRWAVPAKAASEHRSERTRRCVSEERRRQRTPAPSSSPPLTTR